MSFNATEYLAKEIDNPDVRQQCFSDYYDWTYSATHLRTVTFQEAFFRGTSDLQIYKDGRWAVKDCKIFFNKMIAIRWEQETKRYRLMSVFRRKNPHLYYLVRKYLTTHWGLKIDKDDSFSIEPLISTTFVEKDWLEIKREIEKAPGSDIDRGSYVYVNGCLSYYDNDAGTTSTLFVFTTSYPRDRVKINPNIYSHFPILLWLEEQFEVRAVMGTFRVEFYSHSPVIDETNILASLIKSKYPYHPSIMPVKKIGKLWRYDISTNMLEYEQNGRKNQIKVGKGLRKVLKFYDVDIDDNTLKEYTSLLAVDDEYRLEVVSGEDIRKYYDATKMASDTKLGSLGTSCMRHNRCQKYFTFYVKNPNIKMLIYKNSLTGKIKGRALLWKTERDNWFMDRIYSNEKDYNVFYKWAIENGYYRKRYQSYSNKKEFVEPNGEIKFYSRLKIPVENLHENYNYMPYLDTFTYYYEDNTSSDGTKYFLSNKSDWANTSPEITLVSILTSTSGSF